MRVPFFDLRQQYQSLKRQILAQIEVVADSQALVLGPEVERLEHAVAEYCGAAHAIGVSSGTDAELALLMALGIGAGDAVITSAYSFFATAGCIARVGARPELVDIDPATLNMSVEHLARTLDVKGPAKAIIPVHLFGQCCDMDSIIALGRELSVPVLEDAAQALGAEHPRGGAGAIGEAGWFSFYPTKNLGAFGDAGMVVCRDPELGTKLRMLRNHGMHPRYYHTLLGGNFRLDAIQAAVLNVKLPYLNSWSAERRKRAAFYNREIKIRGLEEVIQLPTERWASSGRSNHHIYNQFVVRTQQRDELRTFLQSREV